MSTEQISAAESENNFEGNEWSFSSTPENPLRAADAIINRLKELGWTEENDIDDFELAIHEGLVNAAKHGNEFDPDKKVTVELKLDKDEAWITVTDEGKGFDPQAVPDSTSNEGLMGTSGRGVMLMNAYTDHFETFPNQGKIVLYRKRVR